MTDYELLYNKAIRDMTKEFLARTKAEERTKELSQELDSFVEHHEAQTKDWEARVKELGKSLDRMVHDNTVMQERVRELEEEN